MKYWDIPLSTQSQMSVNVQKKCVLHFRIKITVNY